MKYTCNANNSTYITMFVFAKTNTLWVMLKEYVFSFQISIGLLGIHHVQVYPRQNYLRFLTQPNCKNAQWYEDLTEQPGVVFSPEALGESPGHIIML